MLFWMVPGDRESPGTAHPRVKQPLETSMAEWQIALVREQGIDFAVAVVRDNVLSSPTQRNETVRDLSIALRRPTVIMSDADGEMYGRTDIVRFLSHVHPSRLPWRRMTLR